VACECVRERTDTYSMLSPADIHNDGIYAALTTSIMTLTTTTTTT
jgi:preprotein translocase subunit SecF